MVYENEDRRPEAQHKGSHVGENQHNPHASSNRWRHQESSAFAKHAGLSAAPKAVRDADAHGGVSDLADFLNKSRVEGHRPKSSTGTHMPIIVNGHANTSGLPASQVADQGDGTLNETGVHDQEAETAESVAAHTDGKEIKCGPLINYRKMEDSVWHGSVLIVVKGAREVEDFEPELVLKKADTTKQSNGISNNTNGDDGVSGTESHGVDMNFSKGASMRDRALVSIIFNKFCRGNHERRSTNTSRNQDKRREALW